MTSSSQTNAFKQRLLKAFALAIVATTVAGCIADNAEDTDLPWASNKSWEGLAPISPTVMDRYD